MSGKVIGKVMNYGFPGTVSSAKDAVIESYAAGADIQFGTPVVFDSNYNVVPFGATNTADDFVGIAVRVVKTAADIQGDTYYAANDQVDVLVRGRISVACMAGAPVPKGAAYVRVAADTGLAIGDLVATADSANTVALTNAVWVTGNLDAYKNAELLLKTRNI